MKYQIKHKPRYPKVYYRGNVQLFNIPAFIHLTFYEEGISLGMDGYYNFLREEGLINLLYELILPSILTNVSAIINGEIKVVDQSNTSQKIGWSDVMLTEEQMHYIWKKLHQRYQQARTPYMHDIIKENLKFLMQRKPWIREFREKLGLE